jgi:CBS domain-containing protein
MDVDSVMTRDVEVVRPDATVQEAAMKMKDLNVGSLPVCDGRKLRGMLTDRDLTVRAVAAGRDPKSTLVREVMTKEVVYGRTAQEVVEIAKMMSTHQIRRLPILNEANELVGIVSLGDLAVNTTEDEATEQALEDISRPARPKR